MTTTFDFATRDLTADPQTQNAMFLTAFNSGDGALFDSLYRDDAISNLSGVPLSGSERTKFLTEWLATGPTLKSEVREFYTTGDTALIIVDYDLEMDGPEGGRVRIQGSCTDVVRKGADGKWQMAIDRPVADALPQPV
jgi:ketosteroid isomerase-like protein